MRCALLQILLELRSNDGNEAYDGSDYADGDNGEGPRPMPIWITTFERPFLCDGVVIVHRQ